MTIEWDMIVLSKTGTVTRWSGQSDKHRHMQNWRVVAAICPAIGNEPPYAASMRYLDRTQAWRPLDIHPDWRTWEGATTQTKGSK